MSAYCMFDLSVFYLFLQYFDTVGWVFWPVKNRFPYNLYCVGRDENTAQSNPILSELAQFMSLELGLYLWLLGSIDYICIF